MPAASAATLDLVWPTDLTRLATGEIVYVPHAWRRRLPSLHAYLSALTPVQPATATSLVQGAGSGGASLPAGAKQGRTDFGEAGYGGAAPPPGHGPHRYIFTLYALNTDKLDVPAEATAAYVGFNIHTSPRSARPS